MLVGLRGLKNHHHIREPNQGLQTFKPLLGLGKSRKGHGMRHQWSDPLVELVKGMDEYFNWCQLVIKPPIQCSLTYAQPVAAAVIFTI